MGLNKEKIMPRVKVRVKGQKLAKSVKRAMAFMPGAAASVYKVAMLDAYRTYEANKKKPQVREKADES